MFEIFKSRETKELEAKAKELEAIKTKEKQRQSKYKRVNVTLRTEEWTEIEEYLKEQNISLTEFVRQSFQNLKPYQEIQKGL